MPFKIVRNDITKVKADVIVNTANPNPICASGTDLAIYEAAGEYSCGSKSRIRKFGNRSSGTRKSSFLCLITVPFL